MSFSPIPKYVNVNMEVEFARSTNPSGNLSTNTRLQVPTFSNLSGITYEKSSSGLNYNDIVVLPSGYSYYILAGCHGGDTSDYSWIVNVKLYDEDASANIGTRAYYMNSSTSSTGGSASAAQAFTRLSSSLFLPTLTSSKRLSLMVSYSNGPFNSYSYNHWTVYRIPN